MQRLLFPGAMVHIMARGIDGKKIFGCDDDKSEFLNRFAENRAKIGYICYAWCLMDNHYHFLLRTNEQPLSKLMRPLNGGYAQYFNKKYNRRGYLFQDRYKSVLCQDQEYALQLIRYIHLNPLRGGLVSSFSELADWQWCGHGNLVNEKEKYGMDFQNKLETLRRFGKNPEDALGKYISYLREGIVDDSLELSGQLDHDGEMELRGSFKGWPAVVGNPEFVRSAMERHHVSKWRVHRKSDYNEVLQNIAKSVCDKCGITKQQLFQKGRQNQISLARELFCYEAFQEEKIPYGIIANFLGVTIPPVTYLVRKGGKMGA